MQIYFIATLTVTVFNSLFITTSSDVSELNIYRALYHRLALLWVFACFTVATMFNFTFQYKQIYESSLLYIIYIYCRSFVPMIFTHIIETIKFARIAFSPCNCNKVWEILASLLKLIWYILQVVFIL